ncbi:14296_t:CDS:2, partial [Gigaspora rosea]
LNVLGSDLERFTPRFLLPCFVLEFMDCHIRTGKQQQETMKK